MTHNASSINGIKIELIVFQVNNKMQNELIFFQVNNKMQIQIGFIILCRGLNMCPYLKCGS